MSEPKTLKVLLLFANSSVRDGMAHPAELESLLQEASLKHGHYQIYVSYARSLSYLITNEEFVIRDHRNHLNLDEYDFVYFRKAGASMQQMQACAYYLQEHNIPFFDTEILKASSRNKLSQMAALQRKQIPIPATLFCRNKRRLLRLISTTYADNFAFPVIAKATGGSRGDANFLVKSKDELTALLASNRRHFLIQEFVPNDGDYRFFVAGGVVRGAIYRQADGDSHLNNTSQGAKASLEKLSNFKPALLSQVVEASYTFRRDCAGVDVMFDKNSNKPFFLEVNRAPQIESASFQTEKADWLMSAIDETIANQTPKPKTKPTEPKHLGRFEAVYISNDSEYEEKIHAKVDTGADSSSIHAEDIKIKNGKLHFKISGIRFVTSDFWKKRVKSSNGQYQERFLVVLQIRIGGEYYDIKATLADRSAMNRDMLIGRRFLRSNKFVVDVSKRYTAERKSK